MSEKREVKIGMIECSSLSEDFNIFASDIADFQQHVAKTSKQHMSEDVLIPLIRMWQLQHNLDPEKPAFPQMKERGLIKIEPA